MLYFLQGPSTLPVEAFLAEDEENIDDDQTDDDNDLENDAARSPPRKRSRRDLQRLTPTKTSSRHKRDAQPVQTEISEGRTWCLYLVVF